MHRLLKYAFALFLFAIVAMDIARADIYTTAEDRVNGGGYVYRTTSNGVTTVFSTDLEDPQGIAIDSSGTIYVQDNFSQGLYKLDSLGNATLLANYDTVFESGLAVSNSGIVYAFDFNSGNTQILGFDSTGAIVSTWAAPFSSTSAMAFSPLNGGRLYVTNYDDVKIGYFDAAGFYDTYIDLSTEWPDNYWPTGLAVDTLGNLYVGGGDDGQDQILQVATNFVVTSYVDQDLHGVMGLAWTGSALAIADQACGCGPTNDLMLSNGSGGADQLHDFGEDIYPNFTAYTPIPEPSSIALVCGGIAGIVLLRRKFRRA